MALWYVLWSESLKPHVLETQSLDSHADGIQRRDPWELIRSRGGQGDGAPSQPHDVTGGVTRREQG